MLSHTHCSPLSAAGPPRVAPPPVPADSTTSDESSDAESEDSAAARARAADARLRDRNEPSAPAVAVALPSAAAAFDAVAGPPAFLNPEATRKLPEMARAAAAAGGAAAAEADAPAAPRQRQHGDISRLAPKLPKSDREREAEGVLQSGAKRQRDEGGLAVDVATAAAMLGGGEVKRDRGKATAAQGMDEFLASGGAPLPRKRQERKEREKDKRARGQSTHAEWKSEAEMAMRQQFD